MKSNDKETRVATPEEEKNKGAGNKNVKQSL